MKEKYMSDEELIALIADVEEHDMVTAPPALRGSIVDTIESLERKRKSITEFRRFKARVIAAVAVVILFLMVMPDNNRVPEKEQKSAAEIELEIAERKASFNLGDSHYMSDFFNRKGEKNETGKEK